MVTRVALTSWAASIQDTIEAKEEVIDDASSASSPNEERVDKLKEEIRLLEEMLKLAQEYIDLE